MRQLRPIAGWCVKYVSAKPKVSIADALAAYRAEQTATGMSERHIHVTHREIGYAVTWGKWVELPDITRESVLAYLVWMRDEKGSSGASRRNAKCYLGRFLEWAAATERIDHNPLAGLRLHGCTAGDGVRAYTTDELKRLWHASQGPFDWRWNRAAMAHMPTVLLLGAYAGLRLGDMEKLTWRSVYFDEGPQGLLVTEGKSRVRQLIPLHPVLRRHLLSRRGDGPVIDKCPNEHAITRLAANVGIAEEDAHGRSASHTSLRKWYASEMERQGVRTSVRERLMRHGKVSLVNLRYTDIDLAELTEAVSVLPSILRATKKTGGGGIMDLTRMGEVSDTGDAEIAMNTNSHITTTDRGSCLSRRSQQLSRVGESPVFGRDFGWNDAGTLSDSGIVVGAEGFEPPQPPTVFDALDRILAFAREEFSRMGSGRFSGATNGISDQGPRGPGR